MKNSSRPMSSFKYVYPYLKQKKVLDLGCRDGVYLKLFSRDSIGIDIDSKSIEICKKSGLNVEKINLNRDKLDFPKESFDVVFCSHVLEHLENPVKIIRNARRLIKNKGYIIVGLPIEKNLIRTVLRDDYFKNHEGHIYEFSTRNIQEILNLNGFSMEKIYFEIHMMRGRLSFFLDIYQFLPQTIKSRISHAFWLIAKKQ